MIRRHAVLLAGLLCMLLAWTIPVLAWGQMALGDWQALAGISILCGTGFGYCGWRDWSGRE